MIKPIMKIEPPKASKPYVIWLTASDPKQIWNVLPEGVKPIEAVGYCELDSALLLIGFGWYERPEIVRQANEILEGENSDANL